MKTLDRQKLDVVNKTRSNIFGWRGQFTPKFERFGSQPNRAMSKPKKSIIEVHGTAVSILSGGDGDYISLTDMLQAKDGEFFISDWLRNRNTVEFLGIWESVFNPGSNYGEFATIKSHADEATPVLVPSNSTGLRTSANAVARG